jgi:hypothetical protein
LFRHGIISFGGLLGSGLEVEDMGKWKLSKVEKVNYLEKGKTKVINKKSESIRITGFYATVTDGSQEVKAYSKNESIAIRKAFEIAENPTNYVYFQGNNFLPVRKL